MRKIISRLVAVIVAVVVVVAIFSFVMGIVLRRQVYDLPQQVAKLSDGGASLKIIAYQRGIFYSNAQLEYTSHMGGRSVPVIPKEHLLNALDQSLTTLGDSTTELKLKIAHGPISYLRGHMYWGRAAAVGTVRLVKPSPSSFPSVVILRKPFTIWIRSHWNGDIVLSAKGTPGKVFDQSIQPIMSLSIAKAQASFSLSSQLTKNKGDVSLKGVVATFPQGTVSIKRIHYKINRNRSSTGLWLGQGGISIPELAFKVGPATLAQVSGIRWDYHFSVDDKGLIKWPESLVVERFSVLNQQAGPLKFKFIAQDFRPQGLTALQQVMKKQMISKKSSSQQQLSPQLYQAIQPKLVELLTGTQMNLQTLELQTTFGSAKATAQLRFPVQIEGTVNNPKAMQLLMQAVTAEAKVTVAVPLVQKIMSLVSNSEWATRFQDALQRGVVVKQADQYTVALNYKNKLLTINGKTMAQLFPPPPPPPAVKKTVVNKTVKNKPKEQTIAGTVTIAKPDMKKKQEASAVLGQE